ncbi:TetR/AcrR family transcriptional regulator [Oceanicaulis sp. MMSF_3324]|uniref:TetR/AcrR family transcriptional regulator n=1 Tax=Oceanicaulis sp. MMSF_3324 TaxID=3046702 RepID=UPI00273FBE3E|nr:TetR/AcrR family transcriptional regulator [Oceanicaulis sp. MMSF_3324]
MIGLRDAKKAQVRQALYDAALTQFRDAGYEEASIAQICKAAGVAKGTFFNHFPTKAHILADWYDAAMQDADLKSSLSADASLEACFLNMAENAVLLAGAEPVLWRAKHAYAPQSEDIQRSERETDLRVQAQATALVRAARKRQEIRSDIQDEAFAALYISTVTGVIRQWLSTGESFDLHAALHDRIRTLLSLAAP